MEAENKKEKKEDRKRKEEKRAREEKKARKEKRAKEGKRPDEGKKRQDEKRDRKAQSKTSGQPLTAARTPEAPSQNDGTGESLLTDLELPRDSEGIVTTLPVSIPLQEGTSSRPTPTTESDRPPTPGNHQPLLETIPKTVDRKIQQKVAASEKGGVQVPKDMGPQEKVSRTSAVVVDTPPPAAIEVEVATNTIPPSSGEASVPSITDETMVPSLGKEIPPKVGEAIRSSEPNSLRAEADDTGDDEVVCIARTRTIAPRTSRAKPIVRSVVHIPPGTGPQLSRRPAAPIAPQVMIYRPPAHEYWSHLKPYLPEVWELEAKKPGFVLALHTMTLLPQGYPDNVRLIIPDIPKIAPSRSHRHKRRKASTSYSSSSSSSTSSSSSSSSESSEDSSAKGSHKRKARSPKKKTRSAPNKTSGKSRGTHTRVKGTPVAEVPPTPAPPSDQSEVLNLGTSDYEASTGTRSPSRASAREQPPAASPPGSAPFVEPLPQISAPSSAKTDTPSPRRRPEASGAQRRRNKRRAWCYDCHARGHEYMNCPNPTGESFCPFCGFRFFTEDICPQHGYRTDIHAIGRGAARATGTTATSAAPPPIVSGPSVPLREADWESAIPSAAAQRPRGSTYPSVPAPGRHRSSYAPYPREQYSRAPLAREPARGSPVGYPPAAYHGEWRPYPAECPAHTEYPEPGYPEYPGQYQYDREQPYYPDDLYPRGRGHRG
uniref:Uncharacterized protein n=1 Tax=Bracon brevicornis TaxID=1563983 RepID=A0A6V7LYQ8_9HYME